MIAKGNPPPLGPYPGVRKAWKCRCLNPTCRSIVYPTLGSVNSRFSKCVECAETGFKRRKPMLVYLVYNERLQAAKIGICNVGTLRIERHEGRGWKRHAVECFELGEDAAAVEREVISEWRAQGYSVVLDQGAEYDGWTETVHLSRRMTVESIWTDVLAFRALLKPGNGDTTKGSMTR